MSEATTTISIIALIISVGVLIANGISANSAKKSALASEKSADAAIKSNKLTETKIKQDLSVYYNHELIELFEKADSNINFGILKSGDTVSDSCLKNKHYEIYIESFFDFLNKLFLFHGNEEDFIFNFNSQRAKVQNCVDFKAWVKERQMVWNRVKTTSGFDDNFKALIEKTIKES